MQEADFTSLWVVFDFVDLDLRKLIGSPQTISVAHVQWIVHQMLVAIKYLHSAHVNPARAEPHPDPPRHEPHASKATHAAGSTSQVLHRDLKPANVLLSGTCDVKICDFGLARVINEEARAGPEPPRRAAHAQHVRSSGDRGGRQCRVARRTGVSTKRASPPAPPSSARRPPPRCAHRR